MDDSNGRVTPELFEFFEELGANNDRVWFEANRARYETVVREPLRAFVRAFAGPLERISPHMVADDRKSGGSLFRIHRDTRFSRDKSPYKTWAALQFRHETGKDAHAPGFYLHLQPGAVLAAAGCWHPARDALDSIREAIAERPEAWDRVRREMAASGFTFEGESLKRVPRGYAADHPAADELKRKDFIAVVHLSEDIACRPDFLQRYAEICGRAEPLMRFLTAALEVRW